MKMRLLQFEAAYSRLHDVFAISGKRPGVRCGLRLLLGLAIFCGGGCALIKPKAATDPAYIAAFQAERRHWEKLAAETHTGMTRLEVERLLPPNEAIPGIRGISKYVSAGKTRAQAHSEEWYYISPHFICSIEYDFTGLEYDPYEIDGTGDISVPEFPNVFARGSDPHDNIALTSATITLVEPGRVKKTP